MKRTVGFDPTAKSFQPVLCGWDGSKTGVYKTPLGRVFGERSGRVVMFFESLVFAPYAIGLSIEEAEQLRSGLSRAIDAAKRRQRELTKKVDQLPTGVASIKRKPRAP